MSGLAAGQSAAIKPCRKCGSVERYGFGRCKPCWKQHARRWAVANPEKIRENGLFYYHRNRTRQLLQGFKADMMKTLAAIEARERDSPSDRK